MKRLHILSLFIFVIGCGVGTSYGAVKLPEHLERVLKLDLGALAPFFNPQSQPIENERSEEVQKDAQEALPSLEQQSKELFGLLLSRREDLLEQLEHLLVEKRYNPNVTDADGNTLFMIAAQGGFANLVGILITCDADPNIKNKSGKKVLDYAIEHSLKEKDNPESEKLHRIIAGYTREKSAQNALQNALSERLDLALKMPNKLKKDFEKEVEQERKKAQRERKQKRFEEQNKAEQDAADAAAYQAAQARKARKDQARADKLKRLEEVVELIVDNVDVNKMEQQIAQEEAQKRAARLARKSATTTVSDKAPEASAVQAQQEDHAPASAHGNDDAEIAHPEQPVSGAKKLSANQLARKNARKAKFEQQAKDVAQVLENIVNQVVAVEQLDNQAEFATNKALKDTLDEVNEEHAAKPAQHSPQNTQLIQEKLLESKPKKELKRHPSVTTAVPVAFKQPEDTQKLAAEWDKQLQDARQAFAQKQMQEAIASRDPQRMLNTGIQYAHRGLIQASCKLGANLEAPVDNYGTTPLMHAIKNGATQTVDALVACGANRAASNRIGESVLTLAAAHAVKTNSTDILSRVHISNSAAK